MRTVRIWPSRKGGSGTKPVIMMRTAVKDKTEQFKEKYLVPGGTGKGFGFYLMRKDSSGTDKKQIAVAIRKMTYKEYLSTRYWGLVSLQVKSDAGWRCEICGNRNGLVVHHDEYKWLGFDMYHIDRLRCLCKTCHEKLHGLRG